MRLSYVSNLRMQEEIKRHLQAQPSLFQNTMFRYALLALLCCAPFISAGAIRKRSSSHSGEYGGYGGTRFSHSVNQLDGPITALRIRVDTSYIRGLQVRYGKEWSDYVGGSSGDLQTIMLHPRESIIQVSGKSDTYIRKLKFQTSSGRRFSFGVDAGTSFSAIPLFPGAVLTYFSGRSGSYIDAISFHWDTKPTAAGRD
ncbi:zymogen granule membrane protein 16-like [Sphaerodactylus townsendi]|uniref:zymogen granule membrane protein 16-like n=1 Tax=Sphaerodactylus townsendi TaxID=933632 RepID=UPI00202653A5|nr:zymogen granule membrane protein 16-like [Sphaerodactylus townsendi]